MYVYLFLNCLLISCELHIIDPNLAHLPVPPYLPFTLPPPPPHPNITHTPTNKGEIIEEHISSWKWQYVPVSHSRSLYLYIPTCKSSL